MRKIEINKKLSLIVLIFSLMTINIIMFARTVSVSDSIVKIEVETQRLKIENQQLEQKLFLLSSLTRIDKVADYLGFTQGPQVLELDPLKYVAVR